MTENKISRICWNTEGWRKPSGKSGKSKNPKTFELRAGYGHEEWLLDTTKLIDGWHYTYLQPIGLHRSKYQGQTFNIFLYSINEETKTRWWVGQISGVAVTTPEESKKIYAVYKKNAWLKEMEEQLRVVGANIRAFRKTDPKYFAVIRFQPKSLDILDTPMQFSKHDPTVTATYYILLNQKRTPKLLSNSKQFTFVSGHKAKKSATKSTYEGHSSDIDLVQNQIQTNIYRQLAKEFGEKNVGTEIDTGYGSQIDVVVRENDGGFLFYEIKTSYSVRLCIREALAQLLEYAYYPKSSNAEKLIIVSPNAVTQEAKSYLKFVRESFDIPVYYQRYDPEKEVLENTMN
jgi:hypothetical protein